MPYLKNSFHNTIMLLYLKIASMSMQCKMNQKSKELSSHPKLSEIEYENHCVRKEKYIYYIEHKPMFSTVLFFLRSKKAFGSSNQSIFCLWIIDSIVYKSL